MLVKITYFVSLDSLNVVITESTFHINLLLEKSPSPNSILCLV